MHSLYRSAGTFLVPLTALYKVFGVHQLLGQAFVAILEQVE